MERKKKEAVRQTEQQHKKTALYKKTQRKNMIKERQRDRDKDSERQREEEIQKERKLPVVCWLDTVAPTTPICDNGVLPCMTGVVPTALWRGDAWICQYQVSRSMEVLTIQTPAVWRYLHTHTGMHACTHTHTHTHTHMRAHTLTHMHACMHVCAQPLTGLVSMTWTPPHTHMLTHTHMHTHSRMHTCMHVHVCTHTHTHACIHTHTHQCESRTNLDGLSHNALRCVHHLVNHVAGDDLPLTDGCHGEPRLHHHPAAHGIHHWGRGQWWPTWDTNRTRSRLKVTKTWTCPRWALYMFPLCEASRLKALQRENTQIRIFVCPS